MTGFVAAGILFAAVLADGAGGLRPSESRPQETRPQENRPPQGSLARAVAIFAGADLNHDDKLSAEEARSLPVSAEAFGAEDADRDGFWSREEFLVFYRHQLVASRQPIGTDLDAEITRIQALKRVEAADPAKKPKCETSARAADPNSLSQRFETTLTDVEAKVAARRASREDFQRLRNLVVLNGRVQARGSAASTSSAQIAMLDAIDRIEKRSMQGQDPGDGFETLRRACSPGSATNATEPHGASPRSPTEPPEAAQSQGKAPVRPAPSTTNPAPSQVGSAPSPAGPAAARQRGTPAPPPPKPQPRPSPPRSTNDPSDRSKP